MHTVLRHPLLAAAVAFASAAAAAQSTWQLAVPANHPSRRAHAAMAPDLASGLVWLFGGNTDNAPEGDTWSWNGQDWSQYRPAAAPSGRTGHAMAFDLTRNRLVLFGGETLNLVSDETWEWDGANWTPMASGTPLARSRHAMAFDWLRGRTVLYGGYVVGAANDETWEWNGATWQQFTPATHPGPRAEHGLAFHARTGKAVLFGNNGTGADETWTWDGSTWVHATPPAHPSGRYAFAMAEDGARNVVVLVSGQSGTSLLADTWEWDGYTWVQRTPTTTFAGRAGAMLAFEPIHGMPLLFGGILPGPVTRFDETWLLQATDATSRQFGSGCTGSLGVPVLEADARPWQGSPWTVRVRQVRPNAAVMLAIGTSATTWNGAPLPAPLATFGMPGCSALASLDATVFLLASGGIASLPIAVPTSPHLTGLDVYFQALALDAGVNAAGAVVSNGLAARLGQL